MNNINTRNLAILAALIFVSLFVFGFFATALVAGGTLAASKFLPLLNRTSSDTLAIEQTPLRVGQDILNTIRTQNKA